jgi:hypothetical protein
MGLDPGPCPAGIFSTAPLHLNPTGEVDQMPVNSNQDSSRRVPAGFTQHSGGLASEYAREQGWGMNEDERTQTPRDKQDGGGKDYDYGPRDFGDAAVDASAARPASPPVQGKVT